ncbi:hypothetical protein BB561_004641 [Smittium simulii]|uniref:Uncharacterized protein n=1 Tax=Smittium simulii TaxID=133385 RepID=A0A2T9YF70_9FUNG|nr:hypothetical protein BB561_004641 [Smittium simulii]
MSQLYHSKMEIDSSPIQQHSTLHFTSTSPNFSQPNHDFAPSVLPSTPPSCDAEEQLLAAQALGSLKSKPFTSSKFISRVSELPILNKALSVYDLGKQKSNVLKLGAETLESGVRSVCNPLVNYLDVEQIDDFACRQLDRLEQSNSAFSKAAASDKNSDLHLSIEQKKAKNANFEIRNSYFSSSAFFSKSAAKKPESADLSSEDLPSLKPRPTRWEMLIGSARVHADSLRKDTSKKISFILDWLQYAIDTIQKYSADIKILLETAQKALLSLSNSSRDNLIYAKNSFVLFIADAKKRLSIAVSDIVNIMKSVIETISKYAGTVLPKEARNQVRYLLLELPKRCVNLASFVDSTPVSASSSLHSSAPIPSDSDSFYQSNLADIKDKIVSIEVGGSKIISFATESNVMLENIQTVFKSIAANFETWFESNPQDSIVNNFLLPPISQNKHLNPQMDIDSVSSFDNTQNPGNSSATPATNDAFASNKEISIDGDSISLENSDSSFSIKNVIDNHHTNHLQNSHMNPPTPHKHLNVELPSIVKNLINDTKPVYSMN